MATFKPEIDSNDQLNQVLPWLLESESLFAVYDCRGTGTGFVAITDKRLMFYDREFLRKRKALTSVPFTKITAVSTVDEGGVFNFTATSTLVIRTGSEEFEFDFRGGDKAQRAYRLIMHHVLNDGH